MSEIGTPWAAALDAAMQTLVEAAGSGAAAEDLDGMIAAIAGAGMYEALSLDALADMLDAALGEAAASGAAYVLGRASAAAPDAALSLPGTDPAALAAADLLLLALPVAISDYGLGWDEAVRRLTDRTPVAARLASRAWADVPLQLRDRAFFSSRVDSVNLLQSMRADLATALREARDNTGRLVDRDNFIVRAREIAAREGVDTTGGDPNLIGGLRDIHSSRRLSVVYDTNRDMAEEWARTRADLEPGALDAFPAWTFVRTTPRAQPRPAGFWSGRWRRAGAAVSWAGALRSPRMALKTSPVWSALGALGPFGNPFPPYAWGSGWGREDVSRDEAEREGLLEPDEIVEPETPPGFNEEMDVDVPGDIDPDVLARLRRDFGDQVEISGGRARWRGGEVSDAYASMLSRAGATPLGAPAAGGLLTLAASQNRVDLGAATPRAAALLPGLEGLRLVIRASDVERLAGRARESGRALGLADIASLAHIWRAPESARQLPGARRRLSRRIAGALRHLSLSPADKAGELNPTALEIEK